MRKRDRNYYSDREFILKNGFGNLNGKKYKFSKNGYKKIDVLNNEDYSRKFFKYEFEENIIDNKKVDELNNVVKNCRKKIDELNKMYRKLNKEIENEKVNRLKDNIDDKILEFEYYERVCNKRIVSCYEFV